MPPFRNRHGEPQQRAIVLKIFRVSQFNFVVRWLFAWIAAPLLIAIYVTPAVALDVHVVLSAETDVYRSIANRIDSGVVQRRLGSVRVVDSETFARTDRTKLPDVIVAVGLKATQSVANLHLDVPIISTLIPKSSFEEIARRHKTRANPAPLSAVYLDQPIGRQLDLIRLALPTKKRIGVVLGPESVVLLEQLQAESRRRGLELTAVRIDAESALFPALESVLNQSDVLLSLPDPAVFSSSTIPSVLFATYRHSIPVVGFSPAYVRAGAVMAVYSTPEQLADQVLEGLLPLAGSGRTLPPPRYPDDLTVTVNYRVARSLELVIDKEDSLAAKLGARRAGP